MRSILSVDRTSLHDSVEEVLDLYDARCPNSEFSLGDFWDSLGTPNSPSTLAALVKLDLERRFRLGERPRAAEYFDRFPILTESSGQVVSLVYEEFCLLQECDANPDSEEFCEAYPRWRDSLRSQLLYHRELSRAIGAESRPVRFPSPGERFGDKYRLDSILGRGGMARVYLATEDDLGGRKVVIKVSGSFGQEPAIHAKLDHRNIVPILTVARSESGLRGICMPYRPGVTLEELIRRIGCGPRPRAARLIWDFLKPSDPNEVLPADDLRSGWADFPLKGTFSEAVAWIGLAMTNALSYLHGQGVCHRDFKPANVLLAYREGPQLLDFNLSQDPSAPEHVNAAAKGGTLPYMAPEQLKAFLDSSCWDQVGPAADLYSLGLVLKELVTGQQPDVPSTTSSLPRSISTLLERRTGPQTSIDEINPSVPPTLISIIEKCLAVDPLDRYETASDLADDLRCFLARKPLAHAPNPSKIERAVNWLVRNRQGLLVAAALLVGLGGTFLVSRVRAPGVVPAPAVVAAPAVIPAPVILAAPAVIPISEQVKNHEKLLDSNHREDWEKARIIFDSLEKQYPNSAWPKLYLCLVLEKLGTKAFKEQAQVLVDEACHKVDAEEALRGRLSKDPNSPRLLTNLGIRLRVVEKYALARDVLLKSLQFKKNDIRALTPLAEAERHLGLLQESLEHYSMAEDIGRSNHLISGFVIYQIHKGMFAVSLKLSNKSIDGAPLERNRALASLGQLKSILRDFNEDWRTVEAWKSPKDQEKAKQSYGWTVHFFEGCLASAEAVLAADQSDLEGASDLFEDAQLRLSLARKMLPNKAKDYRELLTQVEAEENLLQARLLRYNIPPIVGLVAPNRDQ
jgi:serine/threonine protein kinase